MVYEKRMGPALSARQPGEHKEKVNVQPAENGILDVEAGFY